MKKSVTILFLLFFILTMLSACSIKLMRYNRAAEKVYNKEMSSNEFYSKFYKLKKKPFVNDCSLVKCEGSYVHEDKNGRFEFYNFLENGLVIESFKMNEYPNSISVLKVKYNHWCYRVTDSIIEVEHVNARDWILNNYITSGYVSGDTIIFTEIRTVQSPWLKPEKISERYVYDSTLTADPLW